MYKAKIIDFYSIKSFHEMFNLSFILMCSKIFSQVEVSLGKTSYDNLLLLSCNTASSIPENVFIKVNNVCEKDTQWGAFLRMFMGGFRILKEYFFLFPNTTLILNYSNVFAFPTLLFINRFFKKKLLIVFHGDLELLAGNRISKSKPSFWYASIYKLSFSRLLSQSNTKIIVLGDSIRQNLLELYPSIESNVISINHPYIFSDKTQCDSSGVRPLIIGILGRQDERKGLKQFLYLAKHFEKHILSGKLIFKSIGAIPSEININEWKCIEWGSSQAMSRTIFEEQVSMVDYILCLYPVDSYKFTASGVTMDALRFLKPIIGLRNNYLKKVTEEYKIGFVADTLDELIKVIDTETVNKSDTSLFKSEILKMRHTFGVSYNAELLERNL